MSEVKCSNSNYMMDLLVFGGVGYITYQILVSKFGDPNDCWPFLTFDYKKPDKKKEDPKKDEPKPTKKPSNQPPKDVPSIKEFIVKSRGLPFPYVPIRESNENLDALVTKEQSTALKILDALKSNDIKYFCIPVSKVEASSYPLVIVNSIKFKTPIIASIDFNFSGDVDVLFLLDLGLTTEDLQNFLMGVVIGFFSYAGFHYIGIEANKYARSILMNTIQARIPRIPN